MSDLHVNDILLAGPVVSDNGNFIIDAPFDVERMKEPYKVILHYLAA